MDQIKNDKGFPIGYVESRGDVLTYRHYKKGVVGTYDKKQMKYTRFISKLGASQPLSKEDYGRSDVLALERLINEGRA